MSSSPVRHERRHPPLSPGPSPRTRGVARAIGPGAGPGPGLLPRGARRWTYAAIGAGLSLATATTGCSLSGLDVPYDAGAGDAARDASSDAPRRSDAVAPGCDGGCDDPACKAAGYACSGGDVPAGFTLIAYDAKKRTDCPEGYGDEQAIVGAPAGTPATCRCVCSGGPAQCVGTTVFEVSSNDCTTSTPTTVDVNDGHCSTIAATLTGGLQYQLDQLGPEPTAQQASCAGEGSVEGSLPAATFNAGATCAVTRPSTSGCAGGAVCAPPASEGFAICIAHPGVVACPTFGFSKTLVVSTGSPGITDTRGCGDCPCASHLACGAASGVTLFPAAACGGAGYEITTGCQTAAGGATSEVSYTVTYPTTGSAACEPTDASAPTGAVTLDDHTETICCVP